MNDGGERSSTGGIEIAPGALLGGRYRVERRIGGGGMGVVFAAVDERLGRPVALKLLHPEHTVASASRQRFLREARAVARLDSEHVVRVFDTGVLEEAGAFLAMERLVGRDVREALREHGRFSQADAISIIVQACRGLAEAHGKGIVHRDLKPANLFLVRSPKQDLHVKVLDFGISKVVGDEAGLDSLTDTGNAVGSPRYMSPEQVRDAKSVGAASDIWSLGAILYELLTGETPFSAESAPALYAMIAADAPTPPRVLRPDVVPALEAICMRCLAKQPEARFANVDELAAALESIGLSDSQPSASTSPSHEQAHGETAGTETLDPVQASSETTPTEPRRAKTRAAVSAIGITFVLSAGAALVVFDRWTTNEAALAQPASASAAMAATAVPLPVASVSSSSTWSTVTQNATSEAPPNAVLTPSTVTPSSPPPASIVRRLDAGEKTPGSASAPPSATASATNLAPTDERAMDTRK